MDYLLEVVPVWINAVKVSKGLFIKINKKTDLSTVMAELERMRQNIA